MSIFLWFTRMSLLPPQLYVAIVLSTWPKFSYRCWDISGDFSWDPSVLPSSKYRASSVLGLSVSSFWPWLRLFTLLLLSCPNITIQSSWELGTVADVSSWCWSWLWFWFLRVVRKADKLLGAEGFATTYTKIIVQNITGWTVAFTLGLVIDKNTHGCCRQKNHVSHDL